MNLQKLIIKLMGARKPQTRLEQLYEKGFRENGRTGSANHLKVLSYKQYDVLYDENSDMVVSYNEVMDKK